MEKPDKTYRKVLEQQVDTNLRQVALSEAIRNSFEGADAKAVVVNAKAFYNFLRGRK